MKMFEGFSDWMKKAAVTAALIPSSNPQAQTINPSNSGDALNDLRAFPDKVENKEYPWSDIQKRKLDINSTKNQKFIDKLKKLYDSANDEYDSQIIKDMILKIIDLDVSFDQKRILSKQTRNLLVPLDSKSKQRILWQMADSIIEKTNKK